MGATPLPLRPDGFGQTLPTPPELVDRRLPTVDHLPPPADGAYHSEIHPIDQATRDRMGNTWTEQCPVTLDELRYLNVGFWGFDGRPHTGEIIVHRDVAEDVVGVFGKLFAAQFPIEEMRLINTGDVQAPPTGDGNITAGFVCRATRQSTQWSAHAYGLAIDINPFHNPYQRGDLVLPELASAYLDRSVDAARDDPAGRRRRHGVRGHRLVLGRAVPVPEGLSALLGNGPLTLAMGGGCAYRGPEDAMSWLAGMFAIVLVLIAIEHLYLTWRDVRRTPDSMDLEDALALGELELRDDRRLGRS